MDRVFLDTNIIIDIFEKRKNIDLKLLTQYYLIYSPLSIHIYSYLYKLKMPFVDLYRLMEKLEAEIYPFDRNILKKSLEGPTSDFEDNVQLHSAAEAECDHFLTNDEKLLKMKFFGKTQIANILES